MSQGFGRDAALEAGWRVLLPPGWTSIPTDPEGSRAAIRKLLDRTFEGSARDELIGVRIELDQALHAQVDQAAAAGARHVHALTEPIRGLPVSATLISVSVPMGNDEELTSALAQVLGRAEGVVESGQVEIGELEALRRVRRTPTAFGDTPDAPRVMTTHVEYVVPLPDETLLVLAFTTTTEPVHVELVLLFDAIAGSLRPSPG